MTTLPKSLLLTLIFFPGELGKDGNVELFWNYSISLKLFPGTHRVKYYQPWANFLPEVIISSLKVNDWWAKTIVTKEKRYVWKRSSEQVKSSFGNLASHFRPNFQNLFLINSGNIIEKNFTKRTVFSYIVCSTRNIQLWRLCRTFDKFPNQFRFKSNSGGTWEFLFGKVCFSLKSSSGHVEYSFGNPVEKITSIFR